MGIAPSDLKARLVPANGTAHRDSERECTVARADYNHDQSPHDPALLPCPHDRIDPAAFRIWFEIEATHATRAPCRAGRGAQGSGGAHLEADKAAGDFDIDRIDSIEAETKHDVIAFLTHVAERTGPEARFLHQGMTSSDVLDTCLAVQLARASDILIEDLDALLAVIKRRAYEHKLTRPSGAAMASMRSR